MALRIHIHYDIKDGPWGGGNQFLKALRSRWRAQGVYEESLKKAGGILFNSHHRLREALRLKMDNPEKIFIHRLDGIMALTRSDPDLDRFIYRTSELVADGLIFQSGWAKDRAYEMGCPRYKNQRVINNAPDSEVFFAKRDQTIHNPIRLIASSWSTNARKGFCFLKWLDENLDFTKYTLTFVGNSPVVFKNIKHIPPQDSQHLSEILRNHDIYLSTGKDDACPNSLIEALHCGLCVVYFASGANSEIVQKAGEPFAVAEEITSAIQKVAQFYQRCQDAISVFNIGQVADRYYRFFEEIDNMKNETLGQLGKIGRLDYLKFIFLEKTYLTCHQFRHLFDRIKNVKDFL